MLLLWGTLASSLWPNDPDQEYSVRQLCFLSVGLCICIAALVRTCDAQNHSRDNVVIEWNQIALQAIRESHLGPPMVARALAVVHTCMYDAWATYDAFALGTQLGQNIRRPARERTALNKKKTISYAAYRALVDLFPEYDRAILQETMNSLGYDPDLPIDSTSPAGIANLTCSAVLAYRHNDGANQLGGQTESGIPYQDWTLNIPVNRPSLVPVESESILDPDHWQPLIYVNSSHEVEIQSFLGAQWYAVKPFALRTADQFRKLLAMSGPPRFGTPEYVQEALELIEISAGLTDRDKAISEYWADGPHSETPAGHWNLFAQYVSRRDHHTVDADIKMFFALNNALLDTSIATWDTKRAFDSVRPITAIATLFSGKQIQSWGGPGKGTAAIDGSNWCPYQRMEFPTPPFPEFVSGHSAFSAAAAEILKRASGSERFGASAIIRPGSSRIEPGLTPERKVRLRWPSFSAASDQAGLSRRYGGIHFKNSDLMGRTLGRLVAEQVWEKAELLWAGSPTDGHRDSLRALAAQSDNTNRRRP